MNEEDIKLLNDNGWMVECHSPFEIRNSEFESFASGYAADLVLNSLKSEAEKEKKYIADLTIRFCQKYNRANKTYNKTTSLMDFGCLGTKTPEQFISDIYYLFKEEGMF
jgi:hypothetical protein